MLLSGSRTKKLLARSPRAVKKIGRSTRWILRSLGFGGVKQFELVVPAIRKPDPGRRSVLFIGPGILQIPPTGWGAVETVISEQMRLMQSSHRTMLLNSNSVWLWFAAFRNKPDVILVHYEAFVTRTVLMNFFFSRRAQIVWTSHYGYLGSPEMWEESFRRQFSRLTRVSRGIDYFVALSPKIASALGECLACPVKEVPNGTSFCPSPYASPQASVAVVGKVEPRKRQWDVVQLGLEAEIHFYGEICDPRISQQDLDTERGDILFHGAVSRLDLSQRLPRHAVLLHLALSEADALVLYEAQMAGLAIVVSRRSLGSQNATLPWIFVVDDILNREEIAKALKDAREYAKTGRDEISSYAKLNYSWSSRLAPLMDLIRL